MITFPAYMAEDGPLHCESNILSAVTEDDLHTITTDQSCMHPQGGGQNCDLGIIRWDGGHMVVQKVYKNDGIIMHTGTIEGALPNSGDLCSMEADAGRRKLMSRLHSAGHLLDAAMVDCGYRLPPTKGYHFPDSPYVEYQGVIAPEEREKAKASLNDKLAALVTAAHSVRIIWDGDPEHERRVEIIPGFGCGCGGTHVRNTRETGIITVRKIKVKNGHTRISYRIDPME